MDVLPSEARAAKRVTFQGRVKILLIPPINKFLKEELFYSAADIEGFELEAYLEDIQRAREARRRLEESCQRHEEYLCNSSDHKSHIKMTPIPLERQPAANAA